MSLHRYLHRALLFLSLSISCSAAHASDFRVSALLGYGHFVIVPDAKTVRSENPGGISLGMDYSLNSALSLALEHSRGVRLSPFSSGISLTQVVARWYFLNPVSSVIASSEAPFEEALIQKAFAPYGGVGLGLATANIVREDPTFTRTKGMGLSLALKGGAEYPLISSLGLRMELGVSYAPIGSNGPIITMHTMVGTYLFL